MFFAEHGHGDFRGREFKGMISNGSQGSMEGQHLSLEPEPVKELKNTIRRFNKNSLIINEKMNFIIDSMSAMQPSEDNYQTAISIQQPIYLGGRLRIGKEQAEKGVEITDIQFQLKKNELLSDIIQTYYNVLLAEKRVEIEKEALELIKEHKKVAEVSFEAGVTLKTDLLQVEIEENRAKQSLRSAQNDLLMAKKMLGNLVGAGLADKEFMQPDYQDRKSVV